MQLDVTVALQSGRSALPAPSTDAVLVPAGKYARPRRAEDALSALRRVDVVCLFRRLNLPLNLGVEEKKYCF